MGSYESSLRWHRQHALKEQLECKKRIIRSKAYDEEQVTSNDDPVAVRFYFRSYGECEIVFACDQKMGKLVPHSGIYP